MIPALRVLLTQILQALLTKPLDMTIVNDAADSVFALSMCCPDTIQQILSSLLSGPAAEAMSTHVNNLMRCLSEQHEKQLEKLVKGTIQIGWGSPGLERLP